MNSMVCRVAKSIMIVIVAQWLPTINSTAIGAPANRGYVLITVQSDMSGTLPLEPDSFWSGPVFAPFTPNKTYLFKMRPGGYSFGGIVAGMSLGWSLSSLSFNSDGLCLAVCDGVSNTVANAITGRGGRTDSEAGERSATRTNSLAIEEQ